MISSTLAAVSDTDWAIITDLVVIFVSAALLAVVMQPVRLAAIPAYLIAGAVIGPRGHGTHCHRPGQRRDGRRNRPRPTRCLDTLTREVRHG